MSSKSSVPQAANSVSQVLMSDTRLLGRRAETNVEHTMRIFSSAEYCLRVAQRMSLTSRSDGVSGVLDFCLMPEKGSSETPSRNDDCSTK